MRRWTALDGSRKKGEMKMEDLFEGFDPSRYEDEARHRWGTSEAFRRVGKAYEALHA